jgi:phage-related protein
VQQSLGDALLPVLMRFGSFAQETLVPAVQELVNVFIAWIDDVDWDAVMSFIGGINDALYDFIYGTDWQGGLDSIGAGFDSFMGFIAPITRALSGLYDTAAPILTELYDNIISGVASPEVQGALSTLTTVFTLLADIFVNVVALAISGMSAQFKAFYDLLLIVWPYIQIFINGMMRIIQPWVDLVVGALTSISLLLKGDFLGAWNTIKSAIGTFFTDVHTATAKFVLDLLIQLGILLISIDDKAKEIGTNIIKGIAKGISDAKQSVINAITGACNDAIAAAKKLLGIASPSKLFADQIGYQMSAGMAAGIIRGGPDSTGAIGAATGSAVGAVNQTTQNYYLSASYQTAQSESSISQDLRAMQLLAGGMA